jgi:hypothetical protein
MRHTSRMRDAYGLIRFMFQRTNPVPGLQDRQTYIPPHIENAMADHVQRSLPPHLKKYRGGNTYIPAHAQTEIAQHLENSLPPHMKQYAGAYMQQHVVEPSLTRRGSSPPSPVVHSGVQNPGGPPGATVQPSVSAPAPTTNQNQSSDPDQSYAFITNPQQPVKPSLLASLPGGNSLIVRIGLVAGGLVVLVVIFGIFRSLLFSGPDLTSFVTIAQEQQELIHLATNVSEQEGGVSAGNQNLAATIQASLTSSQATTIKYLTTNHKKINEKQLQLKVSAATDTQLTAAAAAGTYNQTFRDIMQSKLTIYGNTLATAYKQGFGPKGQALLTDSYRQQQLFQTQLKESINQ